MTSKQNKLNPRLTFDKNNAENFVRPIPEMKPMADEINKELIVISLSNKETCSRKVPMSARVNSQPTSNSK